MDPCDNEVATRQPGLSHGVRDALADPIVQALLAADRVDPQEVADLVRRMAARLSPANPALAAGAAERRSNTNGFDRN